MLFGLFRNTITPEITVQTTDWRGLAFALFGGAALVLAIGYAVTRPATALFSDHDLIRGRDLLEANDSNDDGSTDEIIHDQAANLDELSELKERF